MSLTVGVPTRDRPAELAGLLDLLLADLPPGTQLLVADGGRPVDLPPGVTRIPVAGGVSTGRNALARAATGEVLVFVDDDVRPHPGAVATLAAAVRPGTVVAGRVANLGHRPGEPSGTGALRRTGFGGPVPPGGTPDYAVSALLGVPRDVYTRVTWDERYSSAHLDDVAYGLRLRAAGIRIAVCDQATAEHPRRPRRHDPALAGHRAALVLTRFAAERPGGAWLHALAHVVAEQRGHPRRTLTALDTFTRGLPR